MLVKNGTPVIDYEAIQRQRTSNPLISTLRSLGGLLMLSDGSLGNVTPQDAVTRTPLTMTGGVGNVWPGDESNFRTLLGCRAPVISGATDNLLADQQASLETAGATGYVGQGVDVTVTRSTLWAYHGVACLNIATVGGSANRGAYTDVTALTAASAQYTLSGWIRNNKAISDTFTAYLYDNVGGLQAGPAVTIAAGAVAPVSVTATYGALSATRAAGFRRTTDAAMNFDVDAIQLEAGAVRTPFCLNSRTACAMTIPTATIGMTAGMPLSIVCVVNTPWAGNDGATHYLFDHKPNGGDSKNRIRVVKFNDNKLYFEIYDAAGSSKLCNTAALDATTWAANTNHIVVCIVTAAGVESAYLDGTIFGTLNSGVGNGVIGGVAASVYFGTDSTGALPLNGSILTALIGRVISANEIAYLSRMTQWFPDMSVVGVY